MLSRSICMRRVTLALSRPSRTTLPITSFHPLCLAHLPANASQFHYYISFGTFARIDRYGSLTLFCSRHRQHLQKLRRKEGNNPGSGNDGAGGSAPASAATTPKTPRKRAPAAKKEPGSGAKRKAGAAASATDPVHIDDDEDEDVKPPIKKQKGVKKEEKDA